MTTRVLLVDDQAAFVGALSLNLRARGYEVIEASTASEAIASFDEAPPDIVLLDLGLPDTSGLDVVVHIRRTSGVPILVVSARSDDRDKVTLLDAGADGYITKPFGLDELLARIRAALRRQGQETPASAQRVLTQHFEIDLACRTVRTPDRVVRLTPKEWGLVDYLVQANGRLVSQQELLTEVWGPDCVDNTNYVRVYLVHLRKKLEPEPSRPIYFVTEPGLGVRFDPHPAHTTRGAD